MTIVLVIVIFVSVFVVVVVLITVLSCSIMIDLICYNFSNMFGFDFSLNK